jgi:hypothetical protein
MLLDPTGSNRDGFRLVFNGIHRPCQIVNGASQAFKHLIEHIGGGAFLAKIKLKVRNRQSSG